MPIAVCVDFGSTNSLVSMAYRDRIEILDLSQWATGVAESAYAPSIVSVELDRTQQNRRYVIERAGLDAVRSYDYVEQLICQRCHIWHLGLCADHYRSCPSVRLVHGIKQSLTDTVRTNVYGEVWDVDGFARILAHQLIDAATAAIGGTSLERLVVGYPVAFPGCNGLAERNEAAREKLVTVFEQVTGLPRERIHLAAEPDAAMYAERASVSYRDPGGPVVAIDFGGGTFDVSISTHGSSPYNPEHQDGVPIGGDTLDARIFEHLVAPLLDIPQREARDWSRMRMLRFAGNHWHDTRRTVSPRFAALLSSGRVFRLWEEIEATKRALSEDDQATFRFVFHDPRQGAQELKRQVTRREFESWVAPEMETVFATLDRLLETAGVRPEDVDTVLLTGGSSAIPAFRNRLRSLFSQATIQTREPFTTIAYGLAEWARENIAGLTPGTLAPREEDVLMLEVETSDLEEEALLLFEDDIDSAPEPARTADQPAETGFTADELAWLEGLAAETPPYRVLEMHPSLNYESLFRAARKALSGTVQPPRQDEAAEPERKGLAWSRDELGVVAWLYNIGTDVKLIAQAVQRSPRAVLFELVQMGLLPDSALDDDTLMV